VFHRVASELRNRIALRWAHSGDLPTELPDLLAVLSVQLGPIDRVIYNLTEWATAPKRLRTGGQLVRLAGYYRQPVTRSKYSVSTATRSSCCNTRSHRSDHAHDAMMAAATRDDASTIDGLLGTRTQNRKARVGTAAVE
jgi:hypothetical protein